MKKLFFVPIFVIALTFSMFAQSNVLTENSVNKFSVLSSQKNCSVNFVKSYNKSLGFCILDANNYGTFTDLNNIIKLNVGFDFQGENLDTNVDKFSIFFHSLGPRWVFLKDKPLTAEIDGKRVVIGFYEKNKEFRNAFLNGKLTVESLIFSVERQSLEKIASAKQVKLNVNDLYYKLTADDLISIKVILESSVN